MDLWYRKAEAKWRSLSEKDLRRGRRFGCCINLCPFRRTDPGLAFYGKIYNSNLPGFCKFLEMLRKIGRSIKTGLTKRFLSGTVTTSYERGCGQDDEVVRSYCRSGCQGSCSGGPAGGITAASPIKIASSIFALPALKCNPFCC